MRLWYRATYERKRQRSHCLLASICFGRSNSNLIQWIYFTTQRDWWSSFVFSHSHRVLQSKVGKSSGIRKKKEDPTQELNLLKSSLSFSLSLSLSLSFYHFFELLTELSVLIHWQSDNHWPEATNGHVAKQRLSIAFESEYPFNDVLYSSVQSNHCFMWKKILSTPSWIILCFILKSRNHLLTKNLLHEGEAKCEMRWRMDREGKDVL